MVEFMAKFPENPYKLEKHGYKIVEEDTASSCRWVWCKKSFQHLNEALEFEVTIEYEVSIADDPYASYSENHTYFFNRVYLSIYDLEENEECDLKRNFRCARFDIDLKSLAELDKLINILKGTFIINF